MKTIIYLGTISVVIPLAISVGTFTILMKKQVEPLKTETIDPLTHEQRVWLGALEWCESRGKTGAVKPKDRDNTPSYYSFQFKPGTFVQYGEKYGLIQPELKEGEIMELMKNYTITYKIMERMVLDTDITNKQWRNQLFPECVAKLGTPPRLSTESIDKK